ncbi:MAG: nitrate/nitrite transporter NrtS [Candidatus Binatia bacterium]
MRRFFHYWFRRDTVVRALKVAGVVGPILTLINQYDLLLSGEFTPRLCFKIFLTFLVPYSVSSFSSARAYMESEARVKS